MFEYRFIAGYNYLEPEDRHRDYHTVQIALALTHLTPH
jgi:hypothetical protein